jgi:hypothetical protein
MDIITVTNAHGTFTTTASGLDCVIGEKLPASASSLRAEMSERNPEIDYSDVHSVSALLIMFADMDYPYPASLDQPKASVTITRLDEAGNPDPMLSDPWDQFADADGEHWSDRTDRKYSDPDGYDRSGAYGADGQVYSDADSGL